MESKFKQFINDNKGFVVFYLIWLLLHIILLIAGSGWEGFWPFTGGFPPYGGHYRESGIVHYGTTEFFFYLVVPIIIWAIWKLIGKDIKKKIEGNN